MKKQYRIRSLSLAGIFGLLAFAIVFQMVRIQNSPQAAEFMNRSENWYEGVYRTLYPERGNIFDRQGRLLAGNKTVYEIGVNLRDIRNPQTIALTLSVSLGLDYDTVFNNITNPAEGLMYMALARDVDHNIANELMVMQEQLASQYSQSGDPSLNGLDFRAQLRRTYPENSLASNTIGFVAQNGRGYFGVEEKYNDLLAGVPITVWVPENPNRAEELPEVPRGADLILTIDREIQAAVEEILFDALDETGAVSGTIIVMDPRNGEILALASTPTMDLNNFSDYFTTYQYASEFNRAVGTQYEPGSVFKILTMAAAIDSGTVAPTTTYLDTGFYEIGGRYIYNWDQGAWGVQDMTGCMQNSLNVCMARIADLMGKEKFFTYMQRFGIGRPTGIDLGGEAAGRLKLPNDDDYYDVDLAITAFGQAVAVTPIQMITAASALANEGKMVYPHVLYGMVSATGEYYTPTQVLGTPISPQTARTVSEMLATGLERGGSLARVEGYRIAGKTGTAQVPSEFGGYSSNQINASFIGWGPVDDPQFMVYVWLEKPTSDDWASFLAAPVFSEVVEKLVVLMGIPPDNIRRQLLAGQ